MSNNTEIILKNRKINLEKLLSFGIGGDECVLHRVEGASGSFVGQVKSE